MFSPKYIKSYKIINKKKRFFKSISDGQCHIVNAQECLFDIYKNGSCKAYFVIILIITILVSLLDYMNTPFEVVSGTPKLMASLNPTVFNK
jgi:hypothetical protein